MGSKSGKEKKDKKDPPAEEAPDAAAAADPAAEGGEGEEPKEPGTGEEGSPAPEAAAEGAAEGEEAKPGTEGAPAPEGGAEAAAEGDDKGLPVEGEFPSAPAPESALALDGTLAGTLPLGGAAPKDEAETRTIRISGDGPLGLGLKKQNSRIMVKEVMPDSPAHKAGLRPDEIVVGASGNELTQPEDFEREVVAARARGDSVLDLKVHRSESSYLRAKGEALPVDRKESSELSEAWQNFSSRRKPSTVASEESLPKVSVVPSGIPVYRSDSTSVRVPRRVVEAAVKKRQEALKEAREARENAPLLRATGLSMPCRSFRTPTDAARLAHRLMQRVRCEGGVGTGDAATHQEAAIQAARLLKSMHADGSLYLHVTTTGDQATPNIRMRMHSEFGAESMPGLHRWASLQRKWPGCGPCTASSTTPAPHLRTSPPPSRMRVAENVALTCRQESGPVGCASVLRTIPRLKLRFRRWWTGRNIDIGDIIFF